METINFLKLSYLKQVVKNLSFSLIICTIFSCTPDDGPQPNNPYLPNISVQLDLNLSLPEYNRLNFPGNSYVTYNYGLNGIVVYNINNNQYTAFELSDPNHPLIDCSTLTVQGVIATCNCNDGNSYNILTGEPSEGPGPYPLKPYRVRKSGNVIQVFN